MHPSQRWLSFFSLDVVKPLDPSTKEWLQLALGTLTSLGTVGALIVAVWLANREPKEVIRAHAGERAIIGLGPSGDQSNDVINIEVTNLTSRPVMIRSIGWSVGILRRHYFFQVPDYTDPPSFKLPTPLEYGAVANYNLRRDEFFENASPVCMQLSTAVPWLSARFIFLEVGTSGYPGSFRFRVEASLAKSLVKRASELKHRKSI